MNDQLDLLSMVRAGDVETSRMAARLTDRRAGMRKVLAVLARHPDEAYTDQDIADLASMDKGSAAKRRLDCQRQEWVEFSGEFGTTRNKAKARRWRVTAAGIEAWKAAA